MGVSQLPQGFPAKLCGNYFCCGSTPAGGPQTGVIDMKGHRMSAVYRQRPSAVFAAQAAAELADATAQEIMQWAADTFDDRLCLASSMTDAVLVHLASLAQPGIDVLFLDTGYHFAETIGTRDAVAVMYPVNIVNLEPEMIRDY